MIAISLLQKAISYRNAVRYLVFSTREIYRIAQQYIAKKRVATPGNAFSYSINIVGEAFRLPRDGKPVPYSFDRTAIR